MEQPSSEAQFNSLPKLSLVGEDVGVPHADLTASITERLGSELASVDKLGSFDHEGKTYLFDTNNVDHLELDDAVPGHIRVFFKEKIENKLKGNEKEVAIALGAVTLTAAALTVCVNNLRPKKPKTTPKPIAEHVLEAEVEVSTESSVYSIIKGLRTSVFINLIRKGRRTLS